MTQRFPTICSRRSLLGPLLVLLFAGAALTRARGPEPTEAVTDASNSTTSESASPTPPVIPGGSKKQAVPGQKKAPPPTVEEILDRRLPEVKFDGVGFSDVIDFLRDVSGANIFVNWKALKAAGIDKNAPVTARLFNVKFSKALRVILDSISTAAKIDYAIDDGVITISSGDDLNKNLTTRIYDIHDLLVDVPDFEPAGAAAPATQPASSPRQQRVEQITNLIEDAVASDSWKQNNGQVGSIGELGGRLVITQTPSNQAAVGELLDQLRHGREIPVAVEARLISCDEHVYRMFLADWQKSRVNMAHPPLKTATTRPRDPGVGFFLDDAQIAQFLEATKASPDTSLLSAPTLTLFNGQRAYVHVSSEHSYVQDYSTAATDGETRYEPIRATVEPGLLLDVQATSSADGKFIKLALRPKISILLGMEQSPWPSRPAGSNLVVEEPRTRSIELQTTVSIPDNHTLLLGGMEDPGIGAEAAAGDETRKSAVPGANVEGSAPAAGPGGRPHYLLLLVRPSLIVQREATQAKYPSPRPGSGE